MANIKFGEFCFLIDLQEQRKLFKECFPETIGLPVSSDEHYHWKFQSFPSSLKKRSFEFEARFNNEIIGYYAAIPYEYNINGERKEIGMVCDVMTGVKARGKGVFAQLGIYATNQFKKNGLAFSTGYPIRPEVIPGHKKAGWLFPFQIPMYGKFLKFNSFLKSRNKQFLVPIANLVLTVYNSVFKLFKRTSANINIERYEVSQISQILGLNTFINKWTKETPISLNKSDEFLAWRLSAPEKKYEIIVIRNLAGNDILGYTIVRKLYKEDVPCLGVLDLCFLNSTSKYAKLLINEIEKVAKTLCCELILMMILEHKAKRYKIKGNGFIKTPFPFSFIIKQYDESINPTLLQNEYNWDLMWIDSDDL